MRRTRRGSGSRPARLAGEEPPRLPWPEPADLAESRRSGGTWQSMLFEAGYAGLTWPSEYGGQGLGERMRAIFGEECDRAGAPERLNIIGEDFAGPTIAHFGTDAQKQRYPAPDPHRRGDLVPALLRARFGLRPRLAAHQGRKGRRRLADPGPEDLDQPRAAGGARHPARPHRRRAPAQGNHLFPAPDGQRRRDRPAPRAHARRGGVQRGLPRRRLPARRRASSARSTAAGQFAMATLAFERVAIATGRVNTTKAVDDLIAEIRGP